MTLKYGKHTGAPYEKVAAEDRKYCAWVLREERESNQLSHNMKSFAHYLKTQHGGLMTVGKHSGKFFDELLKEDPEYAVWVQSLTQPGAAMKEFSEYIIEQQQLKEDDGNRKRTRDEANNGKCILCLERSLTAAYIPCGHTVSVDGQNCYCDDQARESSKAKGGKALLASFFPINRCCYECASSMAMENSRCIICRKSAAVQRLFVG